MVQHTEAMKHQAKYLRISDNIISVSGEQKPDNWHRNGAPDFKTKDQAMQAFNDSFIEVSNRDIFGYASLGIHPTADFNLNKIFLPIVDSGLYPIEGLEFEVKCQAQDWNYLEGHPKYWREISLKEYEIDNSQSRRIAIVSLSSTHDTVEPTAKEGEQPWELQIIKNIWRRAYLDSEEDHVKILKEYGEKIASQERSKAIQEISKIIYDDSYSSQEKIIELKKML